jgi:hypothetical protein
MKSRVVLVLWVVVSGACSDPNPVRHLDGCAQGQLSMTVTGPTGYVCHDPFKSTVTIRNDTCDAVTVSAISVVGSVTTGTCAPTPLYSYPITKSVPAAQSVDVFDLTGGMFCCLTTACPSPFQCDETFTFTATTSAGMVMASDAAHLSLDACDVLCP